MMFDFKQVNVSSCVLTTIVKLQKEPRLLPWSMVLCADSHVFNGLSIVSRYQRKSGSGLQFVSQVNVIFIPGSAVTI